MSMFTKYTDTVIQLLICILLYIWIYMIIKLQRPRQIHTNILIFVHTWQSFLHTHILIFVHTWQSFLHTNILIFVHTWQSFLHTNILIFVHTWQSFHFLWYFIVLNVVLWHTILINLSLFTDQWTVHTSNQSLFS